jgi:hypothetical protein
MTCQSKENERTGYVSNSLVLRKLQKNKTMYQARDAVGVYCTQCEQYFPLSESIPSNISRHMDSAHSDLIQQFRETEEMSKMNGKFGLSTITHHFPTKTKQQEKMAFISDQKYLQLLSTLWTFSSLISFMVTKDEYLREILSFSLSVNGTL